MSEKPRYKGGFIEARHIAHHIVVDHIDDQRLLIEKIAEALGEAYDDGVLAEHNAREDPEMKRVIFTKLLREHGIGIAPIEEMKARTLAIVKGEFKPTPDEPKLWFSSIESLVDSLKIMGSDHDDGDVELYEDLVRRLRAEGND